MDPPKVTNPDEIEIEESSEEEEDVQNENDQIVESNVPKAVFGSLAVKVPEEKLGAKDRFKRKRG
jgi:hypothetical protein